MCFDNRKSLKNDAMLEFKHSKYGLENYQAALGRDLMKVENYITEK